MTQAAFASALLDPDLPVPAGLTSPGGGPVARRFAVYRNNVTHGLTEALEAGFPVVRKLVGADFFAAMARDFLRRHPPSSRILMHYGAEFPAFLRAFPPVAHLGYLPDVARLEQALRESYHSADVQPLPQARLALLAGSDMPRLRLQLAPALRLVTSAWPLQDIWRFQTEGGPQPRPVAQDVLVLRPEFDPEVHPLPPGGAAFLKALAQGQRLGAAHALAGPDLDLTTVLTLLVQGRALAGASE
jgi:Putative DNA-binding domain